VAASGGLSTDGGRLPTAVELIELRDVAQRYASGVDRGDTERFLSAFHDDGALVSHDRADHATVTRRRTGHRELGPIPTTVASKYVRTFHLIGNTDYRVDGDEAWGEVYCVAHHYEVVDGEPSDFAMYIRYQDRYARRDGQWRIAERHHLLDWTERRRAEPI
jgi:hypothetical protein